MIAAAAFWQVQRFWESDKTLADHAPLPKVGAVLVFLGALGWFGHALFGS